MKRKILNDVFDATPRMPLFHYTMQKGLMGIIGKQEIWASHNQYLNDSREYTHALEIAREEVARLIAACDSEQTRQLLLTLDGDLAGPEGRGVRAVDGNICVTSFSEDGDSLSQWRAYASAGPGFAVGIPGEDLAELAKRHDFYLACCIYDSGQQREIIRALIEEVVEENKCRWAALQSGSIDPERVQTEEFLLKGGGNLHAYLLRYAPTLKDPAFRDEREWRLISGALPCSSPRFGFREGRSMLIPYYRFPLALQDGRSPFYEVVIGPTPEQELSKVSLQSFLISLDLRETAVRKSSVPYRNW